MVIMYKGIVSLKEGLRGIWLLCYKAYRSVDFGLDAERRKGGHSILPQNSFEVKVVSTQNPLPVSL